MTTVRLQGTSVTFTEHQGKLKVTFPYRPGLVAWVKNLGGARWNPPGKFWTIDPSPRNVIAIKQAAGQIIYPEYSIQIENVSTHRPVMFHQNEGVNFMCARRRALLAFEPGTGKSLIAIEVAEWSGFKHVLWVSTKNALASTRLELAKWGATFKPDMVSYDSLPKLVAEWPAGKSVYQVIVLDEASRVKNPATKRWQAAEHLCNANRAEHPNGIICLMSGTPTPKDPTDIWALIELCAPGYMPEGSPAKLRSTVAVLNKNEASDGRVYNKIATWKDDPNKCNICGLLKDQHDVAWQLINNIQVEDQHAFQPSRNEVAALGDRLSAICLRRTKKQCLDLPEKVYRKFIVTPTPQLQAAAELLAATAPNAITALINMRELSDGFQYERNITPYIVCPCEGKEAYPPCPSCHGSGVINKEERILHEFPTAKDDAMIELLEEYEETGRLVAYAGFQASVDRLTRIAAKAGWGWVRLDGRGMLSSFGANTVDECLLRFQDTDKHPDKILWCGHPMAGGMGITLTASLAIVYWSNDFNLESRLQSEDRIHRIGTRGATIIDLIHLPVDQLVVDRLMKKQTLMKMTMGDLRHELSSITPMAA